MLVFAVSHMVYQLVLLITIQKQVKVIGDAPDDEGREIDLKLSYALYIASMVFGICGNSLLALTGAHGLKIIWHSYKALVKVENLGNDIKHLEVRQKITKIFQRITAISLLIVIQIGLNYVTIQKAQQDFVSEHKSAHRSPDGCLISSKEKEMLSNLRSGYQNSYVALGAMQVLFFVLYSYQLNEFKKY